MKSKFLVPFETAKALKEKGYNSLCDCYYEPDKELYLGILVSNMDYEDCGSCSAPTYHEVVDWLEEKNELLSIEILCGVNPFTKQRYYYGKVTIGKHCEPTEQYGMRVDIRCKKYRCDGLTREEALNKGILKVLEML